MTIKIIDVSKHNGSLYWSKIKKDGIDGVMIRAGDGWYNENDQFQKTIQEAQQRGVNYGIYFYTYATKMEEARWEIQGFLNAIQGLRPHTSGAAFCVA